jgi:hypothetical protein
MKILWGVLTAFWLTLTEKNCRSETLGEPEKNSFYGYKMAKKAAVYAPGELDRVRSKLGPLEADEAKEIAKKLGGEVGYERTEEEEKARHRVRHDRVEVRIGDRPGQPKHRVELAPESDDEASNSGKKKSGRWGGANPLDDPSVLMKAGYWDRIKMDKFAGQPEFEIKAPGQVFYSMVSLFTDVVDYVNPIFVTRRMPEYYKKLEALVLSTRGLIPRNNIKRNEKMKKSAPIAYSILDVIRYWDIEKVSGDMAKIQARPKNAKVSDFADILRAIYKPLFILGKLNLDAHIRTAYKVLYKLLYVENPTEAQNKHQELIRSALTAYSGVQKNVSYLLYPLLMKTVSPNFITYNEFFIERKNRYMAFLDVTEDSQIYPENITMLANENDPDSSEAQSSKDEVAAGESNSPEAKPAGAEEQQKKEELSEEEKERRVAEEAERKALERGINIMNMLFPKSGWDKPSTYPDYYPYFVDIFDLKKGIVNIAPTDPMQQIYILLRCLGELFFGLRYVSFGSVSGSGGNTEGIDSVVGEIINNWYFYTESIFDKEYLPRMTEYVRILEGSAEERSSPYTRKLVMELHWIKRFYLLPYYKFDSFGPPTIQKKDTIAIYAKIRTLRKYLAAVAMGIENGNRAGGAEVHAQCDGIENPWEQYVFQVPNPLSIRLDAILGPKNKTNASLIYFCLAIITVLDHLVNNENSWAYNAPSSLLNRSASGDGLTGVNDRIDADAIFKQSLKQRQKNNAK